MSIKEKKEVLEEYRAYAGSDERNDGGIGCRGRIRRITTQLREGMT